MSTAEIDCQPYTIKPCREDVKLWKENDAIRLQCDMILWQLSKNIESIIVIKFVIVTVNQEIWYY